MSAPTWTALELAEFDRLTMESSSRRQVERISGRLGLDAFIKEHGMEKCNAMYAELMAKESK